MFSMVKFYYLCKNTEGRKHASKKMVHDIARETAQWLGTCTALAEILNSVPTPPQDSFHPPVIPAPEGWVPPSGLHWHCMHVYKPTHRHMHVYNLQNEINVF